MTPCRFDCTADFSFACHRSGRIRSDWSSRAWGAGTACSRVALTEQQQLVDLGISGLLIAQRLLDLLVIALLCLILWAERRTAETHRDGAAAAVAVWGTVGQVGVGVSVAAVVAGCCVFVVRVLSSLCCPSRFCVCR